MTTSITTFERITNILKGITTIDSFEVKYCDDTFAAVKIISGPVKTGIAIDIDGKSNDDIIDTIINTITNAHTQYVHIHG